MLRPQHCPLDGQHLLGGGNGLIKLALRPQPSGLRPQAVPLLQALLALVSGGLAEGR